MPERMIIAVTGTPGTGKTTASEKLAQATGAQVLDITAIIEKNRLFVGEDEDGTKVVEIPKLKAFVEKKLSSTRENIIIDSHISHLMPKTHVIVLRASPLEIERRLAERGYSKEKIRANVEAEFLGSCLHECRSFGNVLELDTTSGLDINDVLSWLETGGRRIRDTDWSREFMEFLS